MNAIHLTLAALLASAAPTATSDEVQWEHGPIAAALAKAKTQDKMCLLYFWADGSEYCGKLYTETLSSAKTAPLLSRLVCYSAKHGDDTADLFKRYKVETLPTMLFVDGDGVPEDIITGFIPPEDFTGEAGRIVEREGTVTGLRKRVAKLDAGSPDELEARWLLAGKLQEVKDQAGHDEHMSYIREADPKGKSKIGAQLLLGDTVQRVVGGGDSEKREKGEEGEEGDKGEPDPSAWDLSPIYELANNLEQREIRFAAWNRIGNLEAYKKDLTAACKAFGEARKLVADDASQDWHNGIARWVVEHAEHVTSKERKLALDYAQTSVKLARKMAKKIVAETKKAKAEGQDEEMCAVDTDKMLARYLDTLAMTYHINRKKSQAVSFAKEACKLDEQNEHYRGTLALVKAGNKK